MTQQLNAFLRYRYIDDLCTFQGAIFTKIHFHFCQKIITHDFMISLKWKNLIFTSKVDWIKVNGNWGHSPWVGIGKRFLACANFFTHVNNLIYMKNSFVFEIINKREGKTEKMWSSRHAPWLCLVGRWICGSLELKVLCFYKWKKKKVQCSPKPVPFLFSIPRKRAVRRKAPGNTLSSSRQTKSKCSSPSSGR